MDALSHIWADVGSGLHEKIISKQQLEGQAWIQFYPQKRGTHMAYAATYIHTHAKRAQAGAREYIQRGKNTRTCV